MAKKENQTVETEKSVNEFIDAIADENRRKDCKELVKIISKQSGFKAKMWGPAIIGFGSYHYKYESGREGDAPLAGFASRANAIALYLSIPESKREAILKRLGKHKIGGGCIYIKSLDDIDKEVIKEMTDLSIESWQKKYPSAK